MKLPAVCGPCRVAVLGDSRGRSDAVRAQTLLQQFEALFLEGTREELERESPAPGPMPREDMRALIADCLL